jgi:phosphatidate cytidylyltransferase
LAVSLLRAKVALACCQDSPTRRCILTVGMKRILTALVLIPLVLSLVFLAPKILFVVITAVVACLAAWEFLNLANQNGSKPPRVLILGSIGLLFAGNYEYPDQTGAVFGFLAVVLLVYTTFRSPVERVLADATASIFCLLYCGLTLMALCSLREESDGPSMLMFLFCVVWSGDIAAMYVGRMWGRHKMAPTLSPNKTWEGAVASVVGSLLVAAGLLALAHWLEQWNSARLSFPDEWWYWLVLALIVNAAAQVGDLVESALKRSVGVKDSGTLLPGHGGVLDRIDALLLAAPVLWYAQVIHQRFS